MVTLLLLLLPSCGPADVVPADDTGLPSSPTSGQGLLNLRIEHNLEDDGCLLTGDCRFELLQDGDPTAWLDEIGTMGDLPVLHWDQAVPWTLFDQDPQGDRVAFYDARLDADLRLYIDGFAHHFAEKGDGYLALSPLDGTRDRLTPLRGTDGDLPFTSACPDLGATMQAPDGTDFQPTRAWTNFALYMAEKLGPRHLALGVELDLYAQLCPSSWPSLLQLYRDSYDAVRPQVPPQTVLFATHTWTGLIGWDDTCRELTWSPCDQEPPAFEGTLDPELCYPIRRDTLDALAEGGRLELLALSFYPDALLMNVEGAPAGFLRAWPDTWDGDEATACQAQAALPPLLDPFEPLDRLGWDGPIAMVETSARSCPTLAQVSDGAQSWIFQLPASPESELYWVDRTLRLAAERELSFTVWSFARDYPPLGPWVFQQGVTDPSVWSLLNTWPCSGLQDADGQPKGEIHARWLAGP